MRFWLFGLALIAVACTKSMHEVAANERWKVEVVLQASGKLGGCSVGELDPSASGPEIAAVCATGEVFVAARDGTAWTSWKVGQLPGEAIGCVIGDLDPGHPGNELLVFGMREGDEDSGGPGMAYVFLPRGRGSWPLQPILMDTGLVHGGCVAELDPFHSGNEALFSGFSHALQVVSGKGRNWKRQRVATLSGPLKSAVAFRGGAALAQADGRLTHLTWQGSGWSLKELSTCDQGYARLDAAGGLLLAARDDGGLELWSEDGPQVIHREADKLRGAVLADLDPASPGLEAATAGYGQRVSVLRQGPDGWQAETVFEDTAGLHHLTHGELDASSPGEELVACGYSGRLLVLGLAQGAARQ